MLPFRTVLKILRLVRGCFGIIQNVDDWTNEFLLKTFVSVQPLWRINFGINKFCMLCGHLMHNTLSTFCPLRLWMSVGRSFTPKIWNRYRLQSCCATFSKLSVDFNLLRKTFQNMECRTVSRESWAFRWTAVYQKSTWRLLCKEISWYVGTDVCKQVTLSRKRW